VQGIGLPEIVGKRHGKGQAQSFGNFRVFEQGMFAHKTVERRRRKLSTHK